MPSGLLRTYMALVPFLGEVLGSDYEVVLHEIGAENRIIAIANGHISGREVGAPPTDKALQLIRSGSYRDSNWQLNYLGVAKDGSTLRSSTFFIKDGRGKLIGLLCVNFDDRKYHDLSRQILSLVHPVGFIDSLPPAGTRPALSEGGANAEHFPNSAEDMVADAIRQATADASVPPDRMTPQEKIHIVDRLNQSGIFIVKGAVSSVAQAIDCSEATVYRYLANLNKRKPQ
ncbi:MAG TPA: PAS domain-containing protein [Oscillospiraceae bacterium]|nr:PAS domain-containing protein [Oscillospiraceae bacterium]HNW04155.1 PAS domain-containing protein [Oscillospiraceae bacterium]